VSRGKKVLWWIVLIFAIYVVYTSPHQAADIVKAVWHLIVVAVGSLFKFFHALLAK